VGLVLLDHGPVDLLVVERAAPRAFLTAADHPLPHYRVGGRVLVRRSDFDHWIQIFRQPPDSRDTGAIVRALMGLDETHESPHRHERVRRA